MCKTSSMCMLVGLGANLPISLMRYSETMKGSNLFYGVLLLFVTYFIGFVASINIGNILGYPVDIPNPFFGLGQMRFFNVPIFIFLGFLGLICILTAFSDDTKIVVEEVSRAR